MARRRELPERLSPGDVVLAGIATHKVSRLLAGIWTAHAIADAVQLAYSAAEQRS